MPIFVLAPLLAAGAIIASQPADPGDDDHGDYVMRQIMATVVSRSDAELDAHLLGLEGAPLTVALELHKDYLRRCRDSANTTREAYRAYDRALMVSGAELPQEQLSAARRARDAHRRIANELHAQYLADLRALAFDAPPGALERVERARERSLARALAPPHTATAIIDLLVLARQLADPIDLTAVDDQAATPAGVLMEFERAVSPACARIIALAEGILRAASEAEARGKQYTREDDTQDRRTIVRLVEQIRVQTDRSVARVAELLPDDQRDQWAQAYNRQRWPEAYEPGPVEAALRSILRLQDLTDAQREQIEVIRQQYRQAVDPLRARHARSNDDLGAAIRADRETWGQPDRSRHRERRAAINAAVERVQDAKADRRATAEQYLERLLGVLTPEQLGTLDATDK